MIRRTQRQTNDPTPDQIRRQTAAIRESWSETERSRRSHERPVGWMPPVFPLTTLPFEEAEQN